MNSVNDLTHRAAARSPFPIFAIGLLSAFLLAGCSRDPATSHYVERTDNLAMTVPSAGWIVAPEGAYLVGEEIWTVYRLTPPAGMAAQVIERATSSLTFRGPPEAPITQHVLGKTWNWNANPGIQFPESPAELENALQDARRLD